MTPAQAAKSWVGRSFRPGVVEQCAAFVRHCFSDANIELPVAKRPADWAVTSGLPQGPGYANSLSGDEVGIYVAAAHLQAGDIVLFRNTYGNYPEGAITHVGISVGNGAFVPRPTADRPVEQVEITGWLSVFAEGRRPKVGTAPDKPRIKLFCHSNGMTLVVEEALQPGSYQVDSAETIVQLGPRK